MIFSKDNNPEKWFRYSDDEEYLIKWMSLSDLKAIDDQSFLKNYFLDWRGEINDENGPIKCTKENKEIFANTFEGQKRLVWATSISVDIQKFIDLDEIKKK